MDNNFNISISAGISADEAIKKISKVTEWWGVNISGNTAKQNDEFIIKMGGDSFFNCTVTELIPGKRIVWLIGDCYMPWYTDKTEWAGTRLIFDINEHGGAIDLHFTHEGLTPGLECYKDCKPGWTHWIANSLRSYFITGKGEFKQR
ncbi:SRPBCC family protein [Mucilaginibacter sp. UYCu711]|uniref:SRPBCC family protein n=1 Tax=Mucilaginibacter sp. UYCu711 TaxID=3156339 RepID=UPI003D1AC7FB